METKNKFIIIGLICLGYSLVSNFWLTLSIIFSFIVMFVTISAMTNGAEDEVDDSEDGIKQVLDAMDTSLEELEVVAATIFMIVSSFIMWVVLFHRFLVAI